MQLLARLKKLSIIEYFLIFLIIVGTFLRLFNLNSNVEFLGDQGRDAMVVSRIFTEGDLVFIGPVTSLGNMYLGPFYYYLMMPFLWLSYPSPMGPVYMMVGFGVVTIALIYYLGKQLIGQRAALIASFFFTFSAVVMQYTRFSWNPNPAPLVSIIMIWATYQAWQKNKWYWVIATLCFSILAQLHYLTLLSAGGIGVIWILQLIEVLNSKVKIDQLKILFFSTLTSILVFLTSTIPLMLFDYKHQFLNLKALSAMIFSDKNFVQAGENTRNIFQVLMETHGRSMQILFEFTLGQQRQLNTILVLISLSILAYLIFFAKNYQHKKGLIVICAYLITAILGTSFYQHTIFIHYIAYLFPITFMIYGVVFDLVLKKPLTWAGAILLLLFSFYFFSYNQPRWPIKKAGWAISDISRTADSIYQHVQKDDIYNIVLLSETRDIDGQNYRYFLTTKENKPVPIERRGEVNTLFIIDEEKKVSDVTSLPIYEIVVFPNKENKQVYQVENGPQITILRK